MHNTSVVILDAICCGRNAALFVEVHLGSCRSGVPIQPQRIINKQTNEQKIIALLSDHGNGFIECA